MHKFYKICSIILAILLLGGEYFAQDFTKEFFAGRRNELGKQLNNTIMIIASGKTPAYRNSDPPFKQEDNFFYLTGYKNADAIALFTSGKYILFIPKKAGFSRPSDSAPKRDFLLETIIEFAPDTAYFTEDFEKVMKRVALDASVIYARRSDKDIYDTISRYAASFDKNNGKKVTDPSPLLSELRINKTAEEVEYIKKAIEITTKAQIEAMKAAKPGVNENTIEAVIDYVYKTNWASGVGFGSIIGSGPNSLVPHYSANDKEMKNGTVCVLDIGAAFNGYSADITRTIPVNGKFTKEQKDIYQAVLKSQKESIKLFKPGTLPSLIEETAANVAKEELFKLGLITDKTSKWQFRIWFIHGVSHSIGLDVHDATPASYYKNGMKPNMIFTIEPGIYISEATLDNIKNSRFGKIDDKELNDFIEKVRPVARKYNNIGVRIEDDVLVTSDGSVVITASCPKEIADVEKVMKQKSMFTD